jgi:hypothetical protein
MPRRLFLYLMALLILAGCSSLRVSSDYDPQYDFSRVHRIAILYPESKDRVITLAQQRFARAIREVLAQKGFKIVDDRKEADLYLLFHLNVTERRQIVTDYEMVGLYPYAYYPYWYGGYGMVPVTREYTWTEGKFVIDAVDPRGNRIVWRGVATDRLKELDTPREREAYIRKVVADVLRNFPPKTDTKENTE